MVLAQDINLNGCSKSKMGIVTLHSGGDRIISGNYVPKKLELSPLSQTSWDPEHVEPANI